MAELDTSENGAMSIQDVSRELVSDCNNIDQTGGPASLGGNTTVRLCVCRQQQNRRNQAMKGDVQQCQRKQRKHGARCNKLSKDESSPDTHYCRVGRLNTLSVRICLYGFVSWLLIGNPLVCDILREAAYWTDQPYVGRTILAEACRGAQVPSDFRPSHRLQPLKENEFVPRYSEQSPIASGPARGPVPFNSSQLKTVITTMIIFKDDEANMEDRKMTKRCEDKLLSLALLVANEWKLTLRVTEAWAPEGSHGPNSLHYEGRAVDINLANRDTSKLPFLARLAYEAGFDWVHYESKHHIHCSVRSDDEDDDTTSINGRCFPGDAEVLTPTGETKLMSHVLPGDRVMSVDRFGKVAPDTVLTFMDVQADNERRNTDFRRHFVSITTETGLELRLTSSHLVYVSSIADEREGGRVASWWNAFKSTPWQASSNSSRRMTTPTVTFAGRVSVGQFLYGLAGDAKDSRAAGASLRPQMVVSVRSTTSNTGAYAPLTSRGTIIVNGAAASCYAAIESDTISHAVMWPVRMYHSIRLAVRGALTVETPQPRSQGISLYAEFLHSVAARILPKSVFVGA